MVPLGLITVPFIENVNKFKTRSVDHFKFNIYSWIFLGSLVNWACLPIDKAISLGSGKILK
jgi:hypothetical protein